MKPAQMYPRRSVQGHKPIPEKSRSQLSRNGATHQLRSLASNQHLYQPPQMTALPSQHVQPHVSGPYRLGSVTPAVTSMSTSVVPVCPSVQQNVRGLSRLGTVTPVVASTRTYVGSVCPHLHPTNHHVQANVPRPLPLESVTPVVISLLIFVVPVFQLVPESVR